MVKTYNNIIFHLKLALMFQQNKILKVVKNIYIHILFKDLGKIQYV